MKQKVCDLDQKRLDQINYIFEHWDELPDYLKGKFEGICITVYDLMLNEKPSDQGQPRQQEEKGR